MGLGFRVVGFGAGAILASQDSIAVVFCGQDFGVLRSGGKDVFDSLKNLMMCGACAHCS